MISHRVNELAGKSCDTAQALKKIQCHAFGLENRTRKPAYFDHDIASDYGFAIGANDLDIRLRIDPPKNFRGRPRSRNDRWFMRNNASAGRQCFRNEKLGGDIALAYIFLKRGCDRIEIVRGHRGEGRTIRIKSNDVY
jgi:hypothetical protein